MFFMMTKEKNLFKVSIKPMFTFKQKPMRKTWTRQNVRKIGDWGAVAFFSLYLQEDGTL